MVVNEGKFQIGIGAIIEHIPTKRILLLRRSSDLEFAPNIWDDVGGRMRDLETPEDTLQREIYEETGIQEINLIKPLDVSHYYRGERKAENQMIVINFWCTTTTIEVTLSKEHSEFKWVLPEEAIDLIEDSSLQNSLKKFIEEKSEKI
ncbi:MAG: NUDIX domain-containing protein [Candidatus Hodarchaeales archaeon]|jgi:8-oxo-dGTP pyrophosphatase MutT (NUDIX family)